MTTWNPSDKGPNITLLNSNLTARLPTSGSGDECVRSTTSKASGKWYFEVVADWTVGGDRMPGIMTASGSLTHFPGFDTQGWGAFFATGSADWLIYNNNASTTFNNGASNGDVVGVCIDLNSNFLYFTKNGVNFLGNPAAGTGGQAIAAGTWFAVVGGVYLGNADMTASFGSTAFAFNPPTGFVAWDSAGQPSTSIIRVNTLETAIKRTYRTVGI